MPSSQIERKLAAIMFTDIAGYTATMSKDQDVALSMLDTKRKALKPLIQKYKGTLVKEMGDGTLSHFPSAIDAANCSLDLQKSLKDNNDLNIRIGVHLGDTSFRDNDVFGDGVNIASRLEKMSPPGGILVSKNVYDELSSRKAYDAISLGLQSMKGVGRLVEVFGLKDEYLVVPTPLDYTDTKVEAHKDKEVPSIAIIPFENKGKQEDAFYAYGISADLISDCSGAGLIRVAGLKDIEKLDYTNLKYEELSEKLLIRYIAQGTLWKMENMFQLSVELYDTKDKKVVWSDRWQENWDNLASIKGNLSNGLLKALDTTSKAEKRAETTNTKAYELYLKAKHTYDKRTDTNDTETARLLLRQAIELDDTLIAAKLQLGISYNQMGDNDEAMKIYIPALKQAEKLGDKVGMGYSLNSIGIVHDNKGEYDKALEYYDRSLKIQEELGDKYGMVYSLNSIGIVHYNRGEYSKAAEYLEKSLAIQKEIGLKGLELYSTIYLNLSYRHLSRDYDEKHLHSFIKDAENIGYELNFRLYQLLDDKSYLETAYRELQDIASEMEEELGKKFLSYPIPKAIVEEYNKVFKK